MQEFSTVSASAKDPAALATTLTEKSAQGWNVVGIVTTTTEVTAFLSRAATASAAAAPAAATPSTAASSATEPAGWAVAPEAATSSMAPIGAATYQPAPSYQPAASATPAVPAGWYADPSGRFDLRYWDGGTWTEHVSRAGQQFTDAPTA